jgi:RHS repeat-associated protein
MPGRKFSAGGSYRYGFNGKEEDDDVKGDGNQQDYGMRIYEPRLGRFLSVDPLTAHYPWYTPYQFAGNKPIQYVDLDGAEETLYGLAKEGAFGKTGSKILLGSIDGVHTSLSKTWSFLSSDMWKANTWKKAANAFGALADISLGNMDGRNDQLAHNLIQPKVDNFNKQIINGDAYSRSKYFSEVGTDILTTYIGSKGFSAFKATTKGLVRSNLAASFYARSGFTAESAISHMEGIDFTKAVQTTTLRKGTVVQQWVGEGGIGNYFTTLENGAAKNLGINYEGRSLKQFTLTEDVKVLKSTAADYKGNAGGGTQFFSTELKTKVTPITQNP